MTKSIRIDDGVYDKLKGLQDKYANLTLSEILDFVIEAKIDFRKIEKLKKI